MNMQEIVAVVLLASITINGQESTYNNTDQAIDHHFPTTNIYAPWRDKYVTTNIDKRDESVKKPCPFCLMRDSGEDEKYLVLYRGKYNMIILNFQPYTKGHLLIAPYDHQPEPKNFSLESRIEMMELTTTSMEIIKKLFDYKGFNIGFNIGAIAGASVPDHLHMQIVPRKAYEASFLHTIAHMSMTHFDLQKEYDRLLPEFRSISSKNDQ